MLSRKLPLTALAVFGALALALAGCGSSSSSGSSAHAASSGSGGSSGGGGDPSSGGSGTFASVPSGTVLNVGDQQEQLETLFKSSGVEAKLPFKINWVEFASGPLVDAGFAAHKIDIGGMGDMPAALSVSSKLNLRVLYLTKAVGNAPDEFFIAKPGIKSIADLRGKTVAYTTGTHESAFALESLAEGGLTQKDIHQADVTLEQLYTVLEAGKVDAAVIDGVPDETSYMKDHPGAKILETNLTAKPTSYSYELAEPSVLANPAKLAALKDFVKAELEANNWAYTHAKEWAIDYYEKIQDETPSIATAGLKAAVNQIDVPASPAVSSALQNVVDLEVRAGAFKSKYSITPLFSDKSWLKEYAKILKEVKQSA